MHDGTYRISVRIIGFVGQAMIEAGVPAAPLRAWLAERAIDPDDAGARVPWTLYRELWAWAEATCPEGALGLRVAEAIPFGARELSDYLLRSAASFGEVARRFLELSRLFDEALIPTIEPRGDQVWFIAALAPGHVPTPAMSDYGMARLLRTIRDLAGERVAATGVHLRRARPRDPGAHAAFFAGPVAYAQPVNALVFPASFLDRPLPSADPGLHQALLTHTRASLRATAPAPLGLVAQVTTLVGELIRAGHDPAQDVVARRLGHSARSLRRALAGEATSFGAIVQDARRARSQALLLEGQRIDEIADRLGYASPEAFLRAFRRWHGAGPRAWLEAHAAAEPAAGDGG